LDIKFECFSNYSSFQLLLVYIIERVGTFVESIVQVVGVC